MASPEWLCHYCEEPLRGGDLLADGPQPLHRECLFRMVAGSAAHQLKECTCYGGTREDAPGLTKREAAQQALDTYRVLNGDVA
jgi:hypothetical protein